MPYDPDIGEYFFALGEHAFIHTIEEWSQFFKRMNWVTFHILHLSWENDSMCPGFEIEAIALGLGFRFRINRSWKGTMVQAALDDMIRRKQTEEEDIDE